MKKSPPLSERIKIYSLLSSSILVPALAANGQVVYTDLDPDFIGGINAGYELDLNNDGITDFHLENDHSGVTGGAWGVFNSVYIDTKPGNAVAITSAYLCKAFEYGTSIGANLVWNEGTEQLIRSFESWGGGGNSIHGNFDETENYLALRFVADGQQHYGWLRLSVSYTAKQYTLFDFAYEAMADHPIAAGDTGTSACSPPANLSETNITSSSATLNWNAVSGAIKYKVRYRVSGTSQWTTKNSNTNSITVNNLTPSTKYTWQVKTICTDESSDWSEKDKFKTSPLKLAASQEETFFDVYPNPFTAKATISFSIQENSYVLIELFDLSGKKLTTVADENLPSGAHEIILNAGRLTSGIYLLQVKANGISEVKKIVVE